MTGYQEDNNFAPLFSASNREAFVSDFSHGLGCSILSPSIWGESIRLVSCHVKKSRKR